MFTVVRGWGRGGVSLLLSVGTGTGTRTGTGTGTATGTVLRRRVFFLFPDTSFPYVDSALVNPVLFPNSTEPFGESFSNDTSLLSVGKWGGGHVEAEKIMEETR